jgi:hypothetical protein
MTFFISVLCSLLTLFVNVTVLEERKFHDYLKKYYIIYKNYYKEVFNLYLDHRFGFLSTILLFSLLLAISDARIEVQKSW